ERVAAHLLVVAPTGDPEVVTTLREAARRAGTRGASDSVVAYLRRALAEPPDSAERAALLLELGSAAILVSGDAAAEPLKEAHALIDAPILRAATALQLGRQLYFLRRGHEADAVFTHALDELAGADTELEILLEVGLIINEWFVPTRQRQA